MIDLMLQMMIALTAMLIAVLLYTRVVKPSSPDTGFNDHMSFYIWKNKNKREDLLLGRYKEVKRHKIKKKLSELDGAINEKAFDVAIHVEKKAKQVAENHDKKKKVKLEQKKKPSKKNKIISELREVYKDD